MASQSRGKAKAAQRRRLIGRFNQLAAEFKTTPTQRSEVTKVAARAATAAKSVSTKRFKVASLVGPAVVQGVAGIFDFHSVLRRPVRLRSSERAANYALCKAFGSVGSSLTFSIQQYSDDPLVVEKMQLAAQTGRHGSETSKAEKR